MNHSNFTTFSTYFELEKFVLLTVIFGTLKSLRSLVMVPTMTAILFSRPCFFILRANLAKDIGGLLILLMKRRFMMISLNLPSVRRAKKRYNLTRSLKQTSSDLGAVLWTLRSFLCEISTPWNTMKNVLTFVHKVCQLKIVWKSSFFSMQFSHQGRSQSARLHNAHH